MRIAVVNPNSTAAMTAVIEQAARNAAHADTGILAITARNSPDAIEGPFDGALAVPDMLRALAAADADVDAHVIACFDDTGLDAARALCLHPVVGIGEAAYHSACLVGHSFCVVTTLSRSAPIIEDNIRRYGFGDRCRRVYASDIPVLALEDAASGAFDVISGFIEKGRAEGAEAVVLGCAGMAKFAAALQRHHRLPVVEGVAAAVGLAETLVRCGLITSRSGLWAQPDRRDLLGRAST